MESELAHKKKNCCISVCVKRGALSEKELRTSAASLLRSFAGGIESLTCSAAEALMCTAAHDERKGGELAHEKERFFVLIEEKL